MLSRIVICALLGLSGCQRPSIGPTPQPTVAGAMPTQRMDVPNLGVCDRLAEMHSRGEDDEED
jgi:hypothetical protein